MFKSILRIWAIFIILTACRLGGDVEALRPKPEENQGPSIPAPSTLVVTAADSLLTVRWAAVEEAENYDIYIGTDQKPPATPVKTISATTTLLDGLVNKTVYYVWVKAKDETASSDFSPRGRGIPWPANEAPAAPGRPVIIPGINRLTVTWEESGGATSYEVYINTLPTAPPAPEIASEKAGVVIENLENDVIYYLWVRAVNNAGKSAYSPPESGTPKIPIIAPAVPDRPVLTAGSRELAVSWQAVQLAAAYEVWLGTSNDSAQALKQGGDITGGVTETVLAGLLNETVYYVWIKAKNLVGTSGFSPSASAKPSAFAVLPQTPAAPTLIPGSGALDISWLSTEGALSYELWTGVTNNPTSAEKHGADISGTSVTLTGLVNGTTYYIWIKSKNNIGTSNFSPLASGTPTAFAAPPPEPQTAPTVTAGSGQLTVSWQTVEGASVYEVWAGMANNTGTATKRGNDVSGLSAVISGLNNGTTYYVWIKAKNSVGTSGFSPVASETPQVYALPPQTPASPAVSIGNSQISVTWAAVQGAEAYEIWLGTDTDPASALQHGADISESLSATIDGLSNGTTYYVWLKAKNSYSASDFSPIASGMPIADAVAPSLSAGNAQISVSWAVIAGADQYELFCGTGANPPQAPAQTINAPATSAAITGLVNGTSYNIWIRGKNPTGTGAMSGSASAKPIGDIGAVTLNAGDSRLSLSWSAVAGTDQYEVYCNTAATMPDSPAQTVSSTTATISGLTNGTTYHVWVRGKNASGSGNASAALSGKPLGTPGAPTLSPGYKQLTVSWTAVAGADEYEVYYGIGTPTTLASTTAQTTAAITGLTNGTAYHVRLRAKNAGGVSDYGPSISHAPSVSPGLYRGDVKIGEQNLSAALTYISANAVTGDNFYIVLGADETVSPATLNYSGNTVGITLLGYGGERTVTLSSNGSMFTVYGGVTLTVDENIALVGRSTNNASLVHVNSGGTFIMNGGSISGNTADMGGGIRVEGVAATVAINDGTINGNIGNSGGGGILVSRNATLIMHGGTINGNEGGWGFGGGGVLVFMGGIFTMYDGTISGNTAIRFGGGVCVDRDSATFIMHGGVIKGNTSGSGSSGGGVCVHGSGSGIFRIVTGTVYGSNESDASLRNIANNGAALYSDESAQRGTFNGTTWVSKGELTTTNNSIRVVNGDLQ